MRWTRPLLGLSVTVLFLWLICRKVDFAAVGAAVSNISGWSLLVCLVFLAADYAARIVRWWWMLRAFNPQMPVGACGWAYLVGISLNNLLPFRAGDFARVWGFNRELHLPAMRLLGTLVLERLLDLMILLMIFFVGLLGAADGKMPAPFVRLVLCIAAAAVGAVLAVLFLSERVRRLIWWVAERPALSRRGWTEPLKHHSGSFFEALGLLRSPRLMLPLIALSVLAWGLEGAVFATTAHALGAQTRAGPWFALATGTLGTLLPSSPGYVGTFDYLTMLGLVAYGAPHDRAAAFAFSVHIILWLPLTVIGASYFFRPGAREMRRYVAGILSAHKDLR